MRTLLLFVLASISACAATITAGTKPVEVTGQVTRKTHLAIGGGEVTVPVIEFNHPVIFQSHRYTEAMLNQANDHLMFEIEFAQSHRIKTRCAFSTVTQWVQATLLCSPDEIHVEP